MSYTTEQKFQMMNKLEQEVTDIALRGTALVPNEMDMPRLRAVADMIFDLSEGRNEVIFDKKGRPNIMVNFPCDETAWLAYLSGDGTYFDKDKKNHLAPAFVVKDKPVDGIRIGKYKDCLVNNTNTHISLYGLPVAYGGGGDVQSFDGLAAASDRINAGACEYGEKIHQFTRAEYCYLALLSVVEGFQVRGASYFGRSGDVSTERGASCGPINDNGYMHVLNGSGPMTWRHDGTPFGVWGLNGPTYDILQGYCTIGGELLFLPNNDAADATSAQLNVNSDSWKGITEDGSFVAKGSAGTLKYDFKAPATGDGQPYELTKEITNRSDSHYGGIATGELTAREGTKIPAYLPIMLCSKLKKNTPRGTSYMRNADSLSRVVWAGSDYWYGSGGGFGLLNGSYFPSNTDNYGSGRVASIMQHKKH